MLSSAEKLLRAKRRVVRKLERDGSSDNTRLSDACRSGDLRSLYASARDELLADGTIASVNGSGPSEFTLGPAYSPDDWESS